MENGKDFSCVNCPKATGRYLQAPEAGPYHGEHVIIGQGLHLVLKAKNPSGSWIVRPSGKQIHGETTRTLLEKHGQTPFPPYIRRGHPAPGEELTYQTVYAQCPGSVAAPTAGLHFTEELFGVSRPQTSRWVDLMLHVGLGTFQPIKVERTRRASNAPRMGRIVPGGCRMY